MEILKTSRSLIVLVALVLAMTKVEVAAFVQAPGRHGAKLQHGNIQTLSRICTCTRTRTCTPLIDTTSKQSPSSATTSLSLPMPKIFRKRNKKENAPKKLKGSAAFVKGLLRRISPFLFAASMVLSIPKNSIASTMVDHSAVSIFTVDASDNVMEEEIATLEREIAAMEEEIASDPKEHNMQVTSEDSAHIVKESESFAKAFDEFESPMRSSAFEEAAPSKAFSSELSLPFLDSLDMEHIVPQRQAFIHKEVVTKSALKVTAITLALASGGGIALNRRVRLRNPTERDSSDDRIVKTSRRKEQETKVVKDILSNIENKKRNQPSGTVQNHKTLEVDEATTLNANASVASWLPRGTKAYFKDTAKTIKPSKKSQENQGPMDAMKPFRKPEGNARAYSTPKIASPEWKAKADEATRAWLKQQLGNTAPPKSAQTYLDRLRMEDEARLTRRAEKEAEAHRQEQLRKEEQEESDRTAAKQLEKELEEAKIAAQKKLEESKAKAVAEQKEKERRAAEMRKEQEEEAMLAAREKKEAMSRKEQKEHQQRQEHEKQAKLAAQKKEDEAKAAALKQDAERLAAEKRKTAEVESSKDEKGDNSKDQTYQFPSHGTRMKDIRTFESEVNDVLKEAEAALAAVEMEESQTDEERSKKVQQERVDDQKKREEAKAKFRVQQQQKQNTNGVTTKKEDDRSQVEGKAKERFVAEQLKRQGREPAKAQSPTDAAEQEQSDRKAASSQKEHDRMRLAQKRQQAMHNWIADAESKARSFFGKSFIVNAQRKEAKSKKEVIRKYNDSETVQHKNLTSSGHSTCVDTEREKDRSKISGTVSDSKIAANGTTGATDYLKSFLSGVKASKDKQKEAEEARQEEERLAIDAAIKAAQAVTGRADNITAEELARQAWQKKSPEEKAEARARAHKIAEEIAARKKADVDKDEVQKANKKTAEIWAREEEERLAELADDSRNKSINESSVYFAHFKQPAKDDEALRQKAKQMVGRVLRNITLDTKKIKEEFRKRNIEAMDTDDIEVQILKAVRQDNVTRTGFADAELGETNYSRNSTQAF